MKFKSADLIIILLPILLAVVSAFFVLLPDDTANAVAVITVDGKVEKRIDLSKDTRLDLNLRESNIIEVKNGEIFISRADCRDKTCVKSGRISKAGQVIVCVPSGLVITIESDDSSYDIMVR
jgi:hypothetical protein